MSNAALAEAYNHVVIWLVTPATLGRPVLGQDMTGELDIQTASGGDHGAPASNGSVPEPSEPRTNTDRDGALKANLLKALGAVAAGVGVLGFVTLAGGTDYWLRFSAAGLPADETVVELSKSQLLVVGARILMPTLALAAVIVVLLYLVEKTFERHPRTVAPRRIVLAILIVVAAVLGDLLVPRRMTLPALLPLAACACVLMAVVTVWACRTHASPLRFVIATIAASAIFVTVSGASVTSELPLVRPVALVVSGRPLAGIYIGSDADTVFVGEVCTRGPDSEVGNAATGSVMSVPRKGISMLLIGSNAGLQESMKRERTLLSSLHALVKLPWGALEAVAPTYSTAAFHVPCTGPAAADLDWVARARG